MKLYRLARGHESEESRELWFTSDFAYLKRAAEYGEAVGIIIINIPDSILLPVCRVHGRKNLPRQFKNKRAFHKGDSAVQVKYEKNCLNFGFYGDTCKLVWQYRVVIEPIIPIGISVPCLEQ